MLKVKDNVDLKELEKYGFVDDEIYTNSDTLDFIYDLIKADLIEKVDDK